MYQDNWVTLAKEADMVESHATSSASTVVLFGGHIYHVACSAIQLTLANNLSPRRLTSHVLQASQL